MKNAAFASFLVGLFAILVGPDAYSHHSFAAEFDADKPVTLTGTVTRIDWMNPHAYIYLDVADPSSGEVMNWAIELGTPNGLRRLGWQRTSVTVGDVLTIEGTLGRYKANLANARTAILTRTGERLGTGSSEERQ